MSLYAFTLSMPSNNSWNGKWSGQDKPYVIVRAVNAKKYKPEPGSYRYSFGDGWVACVEVREVDGKESRRLRKISQGFCGYNWMIDEIIWYKQIRGSVPA